MNDELVQTIVAALIKNPTWNRTNTPPEILAHHMVRSMQLFESTLIERQMHFNRPTGIEAYQYELPEATS